MTKTEPSTDRRPRELIDEATIGRRVDELAERLSRDYAAADELVLVGILKGAFIFLADLTRRLRIPRRVEFMSISSYRSGHRRGAVRLILDLRGGIEGKHVVVVEDIVDSGHTLSYLMKILSARQPASLEACALVQKKERLDVDLDVRYLGFDIPDVWVVGYGLDYAEHYRTLPYIGVLENPNAEARTPGTEKEGL